MIHSCSGGVVREKKTFNFAKVEINDTKEVFWYISNLPLLEAGDEVVVPYGKDNVEMIATVIRIDRNVSEQVTPIPSKHAKEILRMFEK